MQFPQMDCHFIQTAACTKNLSVPHQEIGPTGLINAQVRIQLYHNLQHSLKY